LQSFFTYVAKSNLRERIVFEDHYKASSMGKLDDLVQIIDPINASNNVAQLYTAENAAAIVCPIHPLDKTAHADGSRRA
jgi:hypothetical protein